MNYFRDILLKTSIFKDINKDDIISLASCIKPEIITYGKNQSIFNVGEKLESIAILLSGGVQLFTDDIFGNRNIMAYISEGDLFAEAVPFTRDKKAPVSAICTIDSEVMYIKSEKIFFGCSSACGYHAKLLQNLLQTIAEKNILLNKKTDHISRRSTREKLLSYLNDMQIKFNGKIFDIPFNRQELADYLCVDRSALSSELSKLKSEGIIDYHKYSFKLFV